MLGHCVTSVLDGITDVEVIIVDNASVDGSIDRVKARGAVRIIRNDQNLGFPRAVNVGVAVATGEWIMILNPDARVPGGLAEAALAGLGGPGPFDLVTFAQQGDDQLQASTGPLLTPGEILRQVVLRRRGHARFGPTVRLHGHEFRPLLLGHLSGYCLVSARATFVDLGGFDPGLFWSEDVDLSARALESGLRLGVCTSVAVPHERSYTQRQYSALVTFFQLTAKIGYARRRSPRSLPLVVLAITTTAAGRSLWFRSVCRSSPGARQKALGYRAVVRHVLHRGWRHPEGWDPAMVEVLQRGTDPVGTALSSGLG